MAQCAMSCYVIIMEHAGESGKKKEVLMSLGLGVCLCVNETGNDESVFPCTAEVCMVHALVCCVCVGVYQGCQVDVVLTER